LDAIIAKDILTRLFSTGGSWSLAAVAGYPYITVPAGIIDGIRSESVFWKGIYRPQLIKLLMLLNK